MKIFNDISIVVHTFVKTASGGIEVYGAIQSNSGTIVERAYLCYLTGQEVRKLDENKHLNVIGGNTIMLDKLLNNSVYLAVEEEHDKV